MLSRINNLLAHKSISPQKDMPLYLETLFWLWADHPKCCVLSGDEAHTNFNVFGLTWPVIEPTTFRTPGTQANYYTTEAVKGRFIIVPVIYSRKLIWLSMFIAKD